MAQLFSLPRQLLLNSSLQAVAGAKANFYLAGSTTRTNTYTTSALSVAHANPVVADAAGVFAAIWLDPTISYKVVITTSADVTIYTEDPITEVLTAAQVGAILYPRTTAESNAGVTPTNYAYPPGDVRRYGAVGDGATDDLTALQAALTLSRSHPMLLPPATSFYRITDELVIPGSNAVVIGSGYNSLIRQATASAGVFQRSGSTTLTNIVMRDVYIGVTGNITGGTGFDLEGVSNSKFDNCWVIADSVLQGLLVGFRCHTTNDSTNYSILNHFKMCGARTAVSASARAFIASGASGTSSNSHRVFGGDWQADDGIAWYVPDNGGGAGGVSTQNCVIGATFEGETQQAVHIDGSNNVSQGNVVSACRFENGSGNNGILLDTGSTGNFTSGNMFASGLTNKVVDNGEFNLTVEPGDTAGALVAFSRGSFRGRTPATGALGIFDALVATEAVIALAGYVTGDTVSRIAIKANGRMEWGGGSGAHDVALLRTATGFIGLDTGLLDLTRSTHPTDTAANIASAAASINTTGKFTGKIVWDDTNNRLMRSSGTSTTAPWEVVDGSASVTPA